MTTNTYYMVYEQQEEFSTQVTMSMYKDVK